MENTNFTSKVRKLNKEALGITIDKNTTEMNNIEKGDLITLKIINIKKNNVELPHENITSPKELPHTPRKLNTIQGVVPKLSKTPLDTYSTKKKQFGELKE